MISARFAKFFLSLFPYACEDIRTESFGERPAARRGHPRAGRSHHLSHRQRLRLRLLDPFSPCTRTPAPHSRKGRYRVRRGPPEPRAGCGVLPCGQSDLPDPEAESPGSLHLRPHGLLAGAGQGAGPAADDRCPHSLECRGAVDRRGTRGTAPYGFGPRGRRAGVPDRPRADSRALRPRCGAGDRRRHGGYHADDGSGPDGR